MDSSYNDDPGNEFVAEGLCSDGGNDPNNVRDNSDSHSSEGVVRGASGQRSSRVGLELESVMSPMSPPPRLGHHLSHTSSRT